MRIKEHLQFEFLSCTVSISSKYTEKSGKIFIQIFRQGFEYSSSCAHQNSKYNDQKRYLFLAKKAYKILILILISAKFFPWVERPLLSNLTARATWFHSNTLPYNTRQDNLFKTFTTFLKHCEMTWKRTIVKVDK